MSKKQKGRPAPEPEPPSSEGEEFEEDGEEGFSGEEELGEFEDMEEGSDDGDALMGEGADFDDVSASDDDDVDGGPGARAQAEGALSQPKTLNELALLSAETSDAAILQLEVRTDELSFCQTHCCTSLSCQRLHGLATGSPVGGIRWLRPRRLGTGAAFLRCAALLCKPLWGAPLAVSGKNYLPSLCRIPGVAVPSGPYSGSTSPC